MRIVVKFFIYFIIVILALLFYLLYIPSGTANLYSYLSHLLSKKININVNITSINLHNYPFVVAEMHIKKRAKMKIHGYIHNYSHINMKYTIHTDCIETQKCIINDDINITGTLIGNLFNKDDTPIKITGQGNALDGHIRYSGTKFQRRAEDLHLELTDINSTKLFTLLGEEIKLDGTSNAKLHLSLLEEEKRIGTLHYSAKDQNFYGFPIKLDGNASLNTTKDHFNLLLTAPGTTLHVTKGIYHKKKKTAHAFYTLDIRELQPYEKLLGYKYQGPLYIVGETSYQNKSLRVEGLSNTFGGMLNFLYKDKLVKLYIDKVSFQKFMSMFEYPIFFDGLTTGRINYDFTKSQLDVDTKLTRVKLLHTKVVDVVYAKSKINMLKERFDNSTLKAIYHNDMITGDLILENAQSHLSLTNAQIHTGANTINGFFDFKMQGEEFSGKVYGDLDHPKVNLDMQKLIQYQMTKQLDSFMGKQQRENMEEVIEVMPMGGVAKDVATDAAASFMGIFF